MSRSILAATAGWFDNRVDDEATDQYSALLADSIIVEDGITDSTVASA